MRGRPHELSVHAWLILFTKKCSNLDLIPNKIYAKPKKKISNKTLSVY